MVEVAPLLINNKFKIPQQKNSFKVASFGLIIVQIFQEA